MGLIKDSEYNPEEYNKIGMNFGAWDTAGTAVLQSAFGTASTEAAFGGMMNTLKYSNDPVVSSPTLTKEQLNQRYPGMDYKEDMPVFAAAMLYAHKTKQAEWQTKIDRGPQGFFQGTALQFGASLIPHMLDPLEMGGGMLTAGAFDSIGNALVTKNATSKLGAAFLTNEGKIGIANSMAQGTIGNLSTTPISLLAAKEIGEDIKAYDVFKGAVGTAIGFTAFTHGVSGTWKFLKAKGAKPASIVMKNVLGRLEAGKKVDVQPIISDLQSDIKTKTAPYEYVRVNPENAKEVPWHAAGENINETMSSGNSFGPGTTELFSDPNVAHGIAGNRVDNNPSNVMEVALGERKLLRLDTPIQAQDVPIIKEAFQKSLDIDVFKKFDGQFKTMGDLFKLIDNHIADGKIEISDHDAYMKAVNDHMKESGFDGYLHSQGDGISGGSQKFDTAVLFDHDNLEVKKTEKAQNNYQPDPDAAKKLGEETLSPKSDVDYDPELEKKFKEAETYVKPTIKESEAYAESRQAQLDFMKEDPDVSPEQKTEIERVNKELAGESKIAEATKWLWKCFQ